MKLAEIQLNSDNHCQVWFLLVRLDLS